METTQVFAHPLQAASNAGGSASVSAGVRLSCIGGHVYCLDCLTQYVLKVIDPDGDGSCQPERLIFPIKCPECPLEDCPDGITDDDAVRALSERPLELWVR
jgi:hypothetical protein